MLPKINYLLLLCAFLTPAVFSQSVRLALTPIQDVIDESDDSVPYSKFFNKIQSAIQIPVELDYMQSDRALRLVRKGQLDCIFPVMKGGSLHNNTIFSDPVNGVSLHLFALDKEYRSLSQLRQQVVVYLRGYIFDREKQAEPSVRFFAASDHNLALEMLKRNRASAYLAFFPDIRVATANLTVPELKYDSTNPLIQSYDSFECSDSKNSQQFLHQVNKVIKELAKTGELKTILGSYYEPVPNP